jgi:hypothetical protein
VLIWQQCPHGDSYYKAGCPPEGRFVNNGDGTVSDKCTGLMWMRNTVDVNGDGQWNDLDLTPWCDALKFCEDMTLAGYNDWRLPNVRELASIVDYGQYNPAINPVFRAEIADYWSSTPNSPDNNRPLYEVDFGSGSIFAWHSQALYFRAVRSGGARQCSSKNGDVNGDGKIDMSDGVAILGTLFLGIPQKLLQICSTLSDVGLPQTGQADCYTFAQGKLALAPCDGATCPGQDGFLRVGCPSEGRFIDNSDGTVSDLCTGLMWQQATADTNGDGQINQQDELPQCGAMQYCENLSFGGYNDWRLPNVRELESMVDYGRHNPSTNPVFGAVPAAYWSSTSATFDPGYMVDFGDIAATIGGLPTGDQFYVRAVRGP